MQVLSSNLKNHVIELKKKERKAKQVTKDMKRLMCEERLKDYHFSYRERKNRKTIWYRFLKSQMA